MWKKPTVNEMTMREGNTYEALTEQEMMDINGGVKIGVCVGVGLGGDLKKGSSPVMTGLCYVLGI